MRLLCLAVAAVLAVQVEVSPDGHLRQDRAAMLELVDSLADDGPAGESDVLEADDDDNDMRAGELDEDADDDDDMQTVGGPPAGADGLMQTQREPDCEDAGNVWPQPSKVQMKPGSCTVFTQLLQLSDSKSTSWADKSPMIHNALERYSALMGVPMGQQSEGALEAVDGAYEAVDIDVEDTNAEVGPHMDESYELQVTPPRIVLKAKSPIGVIRGLETLSQLVMKQKGAVGVKGLLKISDSPRFPHRGVLLDSSRHFLPVPVIKSFLDSMSWNKLNVLHWHLTDSQGYTLDDPVSKEYHLQKGANKTGDLYSVHDLKDVVAYAAERGIRVVPEIDGPAHVQSWATGLNMTKETQGMVINCGYKSVMTPVGDKRVPILLDKLIGELASIFPDPDLHLGVDEVDEDCMLKSDAVQSWMHEKNVESYDAVNTAMREYIRMITSLATKHGKRPVVWQEAFEKYGTQDDSGSDLAPAELPKNSLVQVWQGWAETMPWEDVAHNGYQVLQSAGWYLDQGNTTDWQSMYHVEPLEGLRMFVDEHDVHPCDGEEPEDIDDCKKMHKSVSEKTALSKEKAMADDVRGGEACLWGESIDGSNLALKAWPRLSAVAERLWSPRSVTSAISATPRLEEMACRMQARGVIGTSVPGMKTCAEK